MIKQYRIDRFNGVEFLVCEMYGRHTWSKEENGAYASFMDAPGGIHVGITRSEFRALLDEWLQSEHDEKETFYGLVEPIPVIEYLPCIVLRGAIVSNKVASLAVDFLASVTVTEVKDAVSSFLDFTLSPHWRNTVLNQISANYGNLFASEDNS